MLQKKITVFAILGSNGFWKISFSKFFFFNFWFQIRNLLQILHKVLLFKTFLKKNLVPKKIIVGKTNGLGLPKNNGFWQISFSKKLFFNFWLQIPILRVILHKKTYFELCHYFFSWKFLPVTNEAVLLPLCVVYYQQELYVHVDKRRWPQIRETRKFSGVDCRREPELGDVGVRFLHRAPRAPSVMG